MIILYVILSQEIAFAYYICFPFFFSDVTNNFLKTIAVTVANLSTLISWKHVNNWDKVKKISVTDRQADAGEFTGHSSG